MKAKPKSPRLPGNPKQRAQGIKRRQQIRRWLAEGISPNRIAGRLDMTTQNLQRHIRIIEAEDKQNREGAA